LGKIRNEQRKRMMHLALLGYTGLVNLPASGYRMQCISCFLLKHGRRYERKKWGYRHQVWLADLQFEHATQQFALQS
jgi:hypothetical protein